eukprot:TRINITY_DN139_c0_g2_i13.p1 TRINITY_DN139_c0_g2~~TRINITY_DN139_c0_g2_i13.p1  ORF type:complete len:267 (+),score=33.60 TRINITY_DN139_c0_g2_i13:530-1330(+)
MGATKFCYYQNFKATIIQRECLDRVYKHLTLQDLYKLASSFKSLRSVKRRVQSVKLLLLSEHQFQRGNMEKVVQEQEVNVNKSSEIEQALSQAVVLINSNMICEAVEVLTGVLDVAMDKYGETALECAPLFFRYGQALLFQAQDLHKYSQDNEERRMSKDECSDEDEYSSDSSSDEDEQGVEECGDKLEKQNIVDASHCEEETQEIENEAKQDGCKDIQNIDEAKQDGCKDIQNIDEAKQDGCFLIIIYILLVSHQILRFLVIILF